MVPGPIQVPKLAAAQWHPRARGACLLTVIEASVRACVQGCLGLQPSMANSSGERALSQGLLCSCVR